jgi:OHCU decarboxylase
MSRALAAELLGDVFERSPWIAAEAQAAGLGAPQDNAEGLHAAMAAVVDAAPRERKLALLRAHPDLAGRLTVAELTADSAKEQASAGLDGLSGEERDRFLALNDAYRSKFGFPFIMAVKGRTKAEILAAFEGRLGHDETREFETALGEVKAIALGRLKERLPSASDAFVRTA